MVHGAVVYLRAWQIARVRVNGLFLIVKIEFGIVVSESQVGFKESVDCADVFPVVVKNIRAKLLLPEKPRDYFLAEVDFSSAHFFFQNFRGKHINAHRRQTIVLALVL